MEIKKLVLVRGLPGSGKSTFADMLSELAGFQSFSLDTFFMDEKGNYAFDFKRNHLAYKDCQNKVEIAMKAEAPRILVDQTFALLWEIQPYLELGKKYSYQIFVCTMENRHEGENIHGITDEQLVKMSKNFNLQLLPERLRSKNES